MRLWMALVLVGGSLGCGGSSGSNGSNLRTLTRDDVTGLAPGNATGSAFSGLYRITENHIEDCRCRAGDCSTLTANVGRIAPAMQTDGWLQLGDPGALAEGGVDSDGTFHLAYLNEDPANTQYALTEGNITAAGGTPTSMAMVQEATGVTDAIDCDVRTRTVASYVGPLTAALAP